MAAISVIKPQNAYSPLLISAFLSFSCSSIKRANLHAVPPSHILSHYELHAHFWLLGSCVSLDASVLTSHRKTSISTVDQKVHPKPPGLHTTDLLGPKK